MESDAAAGTSGATHSPEESQALNSTILEYYKKFGRKRDLEQYFSLNTAQSEVKDVSSLFWRRMKSQDSSDSGEKSRDTSLEVCRIQIKCSAVDIDQQGSSQDDTRTKSDSESPPIITEDAPQPLDTSQHTDDESIKSDDDKSVKSDDNNSQKSNDAILDTSINKAYSPSSSITSQRKLEWDSLADVGYANESDKKHSASSLSTLERLALKQQYSNNDTHQSNTMGPPTAHSTPVDEADLKSKSRKGSKTTRIYRKDVDCVEVNLPQGPDNNLSQSINVNLTKHISFSVDKSGEVSVGNVEKDYSVSPEKKSIETNITPQVTVDKEIQTSLIKTKDKSSSSGEIPKPFQLYGQGVPVLINLNNLKKRARRKKVNLAKKNIRIRRKIDADKENLPVLEKSGEQVSEAESFEYMPGHIYNQNQMNIEPSRSSQTAGNKSSLESSGAATTDSSKGSKHSFTKDLENSIKLLRSALNKRYDDAELKQKLIKEVVQRLLKSNYRDDESTTDFLSGLSFSSKKLGLRSDNNTTTSTSDATNNTMEKCKLARPKKSILRVEKFNSGAIASTSQSAPNLPTAINSENQVSTSLTKVLTTSYSSSDATSKEKTSSDTAFAKTSSEELYQKYLDALRREQAYKKHLREKEQFLKQKLVASDVGARNSTTLTGPAAQLDVKSRLKLKQLMKDLTRNNYDDGSGDASKLEGGLASGIGLKLNEGRNQRSHSVFTLSSSGNSDQNRRPNPKKTDMKDTKAGHSKDEHHYCCCPHHFGNKADITDSSVQVNIRSEVGTSPRQNDNVVVGPSCPAKAKASQPVTHVVSDDNTGDIKYLCLCHPELAEAKSPAENFLIYKCSRLSSKGICCNVAELPKANALRFRCYDSEEMKTSKGSQTCINKPDSSGKETIVLHEAIRVTQTDISINPRISDPSLSDIKITRDCDCVKLVREQFRQVSKSSIDSDGNANVEKNTAQVADNEMYNQPSTSNLARSGKVNNIKSTKDVQIQSELEAHDHEGKSPGFYGDSGDYTIPIQGTNMTLKVSVGSKPVTNMEILDSRGLRTTELTDSNNIVQEKEYNDNAVGTNSATCLNGECSKGVQSDSKGLFSQYDHKPRTVNTIFTNQEVYKECPSKTNQQQRKPLRSRTFPDIEETQSGIRNEILRDFYEQEQWSTYSNSSEPRVICACPNPNQCNCREKELRSYYPDTKEHTILYADPNPNQSDNRGIEPRATYPKMSETRNLCACPNPNQCNCREKENRSTYPNTLEPRILYANPNSNQSDSRGKELRSTYPKMSEPKNLCACPNPNQCNCREKELQSTYPNTIEPILYAHPIPNQSDSRELLSTYPKPSEPRNLCACPNPNQCDCKEKEKRPTYPNTLEPRILYANPNPNQSDDRGKELRSTYPKTSELRTVCACPNPNQCNCKGKEMRSTYPKASDPRIFSVFPNPNPWYYREKDVQSTLPKTLDSVAMCPCPNPDQCVCKEKELQSTYPKTSEPVVICACPKPETKEKTPVESVDSVVKNKKEIVSEEKPVSPRKSPDPSPRHEIKPLRRRQPFLRTGLPEDPIIPSTEDNESPSEEILVSRMGAGPSKINTDSNDLITNVIKDITNRYSKKDLVKGQKKKCFKEIVSILNHLLDTEDCECDTDAITDLKNIVCECSSSESCACPSLLQPNNTKKEAESLPKPTENVETEKRKTTSDKGVQQSGIRKSRPAKIESSDLPTSSEIPCTSSDSVTCKVLNKIRKECEKYHRKCCKRCKSPKRYKCSNVTSCDQCKRLVFCQCQALSANCDQCQRVHYCQCRPHNRCKCKGYRPKSVCERVKKKCVAYNLIIQTSESMVSEEFTKNCRPLKNIIVKVPSKKQTSCNMPFKEMNCDTRKLSSPRSEARSCRSRSCPNDSLSSTDDCMKGKVYTVRDYLEKNRPDFIEQTGKRQKCLKMINEARANRREAQRKLLSMQVQMEPALRALSESDWRDLAKELGFKMRQRQEPPKLISEREMKKHSERIYKTLPEVVQKKEDLKKENIKKTNLLMANIFKKNLQKKTLRGSVNLSNYSPVIEI